MSATFDHFPSGILQAEGVGACGHISYSLHIGRVTIIGQFRAHDAPKGTGNVSRCVF